MRVLGIDLSTRAGVALVESGGAVLHAGIVTHPKLTGLPRVNAIVADILSIRDEFKPDHIYVEDYALGLNMGAVIVQVEISTVLQFILWQDSTLVHLVHPSTLKKFVTGSGAAKKELMLLEVYKRWGHTAKGNDEADAVSLAHFGLAARGVAVNCSQIMKDVALNWVTNQKFPLLKKSKKSKT